MIKQIAISFVTVFLILKYPVRAAPGFAVSYLIPMAVCPATPDVGVTDTQLGALLIIQLFPDAANAGTIVPVPALGPDTRNGNIPIEVGALVWLTVTTAVFPVKSL